MTFQCREYLSWGFPSSLKGDLRSVAQTSYSSIHKRPNPNLLIQFLLWRVYIFFWPFVTELLHSFLLRNISKHGLLCGI